jgi:hypothetical protein
MMSVDLAVGDYQYFLPSAALLRHFMKPGFAISAAAASRVWHAPDGELAVIRRILATEASIRNDIPGAEPKSRRKHR